jgi:SAM-dependent methyltransferase
MTTPHSYDVFLSYNNEDKEAVNTIAERLSDEFGLHPYFDSWAMIRGDHWRVSLEQGLAQSRVCAIFIGPDGLGPWENRELSAYLDMSVTDRNLRLIPVLLPGVNKKQLDLPPFIKSLSWVDFTDGLSNDREFGALVCSIRGIPPGRPLPVELPSESRYVQKSIRETMANLLKDQSLDIESYLTSRDSTLRLLAKRAQVLHPHLTTLEIRLKLKNARELAFQDKYAGIAEYEDERFLKYEAWEQEFERLLADMGVDNVSTVEAINVGIGNGNEHPQFYNRFRSLVGVDISKHSLELAKQRLPNMEVWQVEAEKLVSIASVSRDLYISLRTYQSTLFDVEESLFEAYRVLRPKGFCLISIPYVYYVNGEIMKGLIRPGSRDELDVDLPYVIANRIRRGLVALDFDPVGLRTGHFEVYIYGQKGR